MRLALPLTKGFAVRCNSPKWLVPLVLLTLGTDYCPPAVRAETIDFQDLTLRAESFWNGSDQSGGFTSRGAFFNNNYNPAYGSWSAWAYSNTTDQTTPGIANQYSAYTTSGPDPLNNYGVAYTNVWGSDEPARITLPAGRVIESAMITNTTYAFLAVRDGNDGPGAGFVKGPFGGDDGTDPDWFLLTISGLDESNQPIDADPVDFYLADYRFEGDNPLDYVIDDWTEVDLSSLADARKLEFHLTSSDVGDWGMNTPALFAMDDVTTVAEPSTIVMLLAALPLLLWWSRRRRRGVN